MTCYAIGIGGTGARCVEALLHVCAAGLFPRPSESLVVGLVDPDKSNGSVTRTRNVLDAYRKSRATVGGEGKLFPVAITAAAGEVWSVLEGHDARLAIDNTRFDKLFEKETLAQSVSDSPIADLMDVLFTEEEQSFTLEVGFRGKPSLGSAVFAKDGLLDNSPFWQSIFESLGGAASSFRTAERPDKIILFGSIFGGTGAAGLPTLAHLIRNKLAEKNMRHVDIAAAVMLPYFSFQKPKDKIAADAGEFIANTRRALEFYGGGSLNGFIDELYFVGESRRSSIGNDQTAISGPKQRNPAHLAELCSALAAVDFFSVKGATAREQAEVTKVHFASRRAEDSVVWADLPFAEPVKLRSNMVQLIRFALALNHLFAPMLREIQAKGIGSHAPWFIDQFGKENDAFHKEHENILNNVMAFSNNTSGYIEYLLQWMEQLGDCENLNIELFALDDVAYHGKSSDNTAEPASDILNKILKDYSRSDNLPLGKVWSRVCDKAAALPRDKPLSSLLQSIYEGCA